MLDQLGAGTLRQVVKAQQEAVIDYRVISKRHQRTLELHALRNPPLNGCQCFTFGNILAEAKPSTATEFAINSDAHKTVLGPAVGTNPLVDIAHNRGSIVDFCMGSEDARAILVNVDPETLAAPFHALPSLCITCVAKLAGKRL